MDRSQFIEKKNNKKENYGFVINKKKEEYITDDYEDIFSESSEEDLDLEYPNEESNNKARKQILKILLEN